MNRCITGKNCYYSRELAEEALIQAWVRRHFTPGTGPVNVYKCDDCGDYHLTSGGELNSRLAEAIKNGSIDKLREAEDWELKWRRRRR